MADTAADSSSTAVEPSASEAAGCTVLPRAMETNLRFKVVAIERPLAPFILRISS